MCNSPGWTPRHSHPTLHRDPRGRRRGAPRVAAGEGSSPLPRFLLARVPGRAPRVCFALPGRQGPLLAEAFLRRARCQRGAAPAADTDRKYATTKTGRNVHAEKSHISNTIFFFFDFFFFACVCFWRLPRTARPPRGLRRPGRGAAPASSPRRSRRPPPPCPRRQPRPAAALRGWRRRSSTARPRWAARRSSSA